MSTLSKTKSTVVLLGVFAGLASAVIAARSDRRFVNAYGEPTGFGVPPATDLPTAYERQKSVAFTGAPGLYRFPGTGNSEFASIGERQERRENEGRTNVNIGPIEVLPSGPTGPMTPVAMDAATEEVTTEVLAEIKDTDHTMSALKNQADDRDDFTRIRFRMAARDVSARRHALREDLKNVRAADADHWSEARNAVSTSFNAYVESRHHAEEVLTAKPPY